jgi:hypothetical protein
MKNDGKETRDVDGAQGSTLPILETGPYGVRIMKHNRSLEKKKKKRRQKLKRTRDENLI